MKAVGPCDIYILSPCYIGEFPDISNDAWSIVYKFNESISSVVSTGEIDRFEEFFLTKRVECLAR